MLTPSCVRDRAFRCETSAPSQRASQRPLPPSRGCCPNTSFRKLPASPGRSAGPCSWKRTRNPKVRLPCGPRQRGLCTAAEERLLLSVTQFHCRLRTARPRVQAAPSREERTPYLQPLPAGLSRGAALAPCQVDEVYAAADPVVVLSPVHKLRLRQTASRSHIASPS